MLWRKQRKNNRQRTHIEFQAEGWPFYGQSLPRKPLLNFYLIR
jgi:hypothetical protein